MKLSFLSVDLQHEFTRPEGKWYNPGKSISFVKETLVPFLKEKNIKVAEIISDYRQPRPGDSGDGCYPGTTGYISELSLDVKYPEQWVKCMNSPVWIRDGIGDAQAKPGLPYQDTEKFGQWLTQYVGFPENTHVILFGLTADWCVFSTAQELTWRGYQVSILEEATDVAGGDESYKKQVLEKSPLCNWADKITFKEVQSFFS